MAGQRPGLLIFDFKARGEAGRFWGNSLNIDLIPLEAFKSGELIRRTGAEPETEWRWERKKEALRGGGFFRNKSDNDHLWKPRAMLALILWSRQTIASNSLKNALPTLRGRGVAPFLIMKALSETIIHIAKTEEDGPAAARLLLSSHADFPIWTGDNGHSGKFFRVIAKYHGSKSRQPMRA
jgi:hypothetical protein